MKKTILAVLAALILVPAGLKAQKTDQAIAKIRKDYAAALEKINTAGGYYEDVFVNCATVNIQEMWSGSGPHKETTEIFYAMGLNEEWTFDRHIFFVRHKSNVSVRDFYTEILYDENGKPEFYYYKAYGYDGNALEWRFYWENGKLIRGLAPKNINTDDFPDSQPTPESAYKAAENFISYLTRL